MAFLLAVSLHFGSEAVGFFWQRVRFLSLVEGGRVSCKSLVWTKGKF
jgi:hypothetical protein